MLLDPSTGATLRAGLPPVHVMHPFPEARFAATHPTQELSAVIPHAGICTGAARKGSPYHDSERRRVRLRLRVAFGHQQ